MPRVSVVIPAYNHAGFLDAVAASVLAQTFDDFELIIVDDGSQDETRDVCAHLCQHDARVRYIFQDNKGLSGARNTGIRSARSDFIALLDADDLWEPTKLSKQLAVIERDATVGVVYSDCTFIDEARRTWPAVKHMELGLTTIYEELLYENVVHGSASAVLIRKECFDRVGLFDESLRSMEDWDMWLRIAAYYRFAKIPEALVHLMQHSEQMHRNTAVMATARLALTRKINVSILPQYEFHLAKVQWHNQLWAAELYLLAKRRHACVRALLLAIYSWPLSVFVPRTWYVTALFLSGPLYPQAKDLGSLLSRACRRYLNIDSKTGLGRLRERQRAIP